MAIAISLLFLIVFIPTVSAIPTTGAVSAISSNNVTIHVLGITGNDVWIIWGQNSGGECWRTDNQTPNIGAADVLVWGAPLTGGTSYYAKACDSSGCGNEVTFTLAQITPLPTTTFGYVYQNLSRSHFNLQYIAPSIDQVYTRNFPRLVLYGVLIGMIFLGLWLRTRSIRLVSSLGIIMGMMLFSPTTGLYLGIPGSEQLLGGVLLAAGLSGWVLALWLKK